MVSFLLYVEGSIDGPTEPYLLAQHFGPVSTAPLAVTLNNGTAGTNFRETQKKISGFAESTPTHKLEP